MQLNFDSLYELAQFFDWVQGQRATAPVVEDVPAEQRYELVTAKEATNDVPERLDYIPPPGQSVEADKPARKRRTKAEMEAARAAAPDLKDEMEAARAAETANPTEAAGETQTEPATTGSTEVAEATAATTPAASAPDSMQDAISFIKSRVTERPEVSQVEHLNLARTFIGKHGMEKYNQSFPLAGLTPNVMGYSPADCATHAAALDFLSLE